GYSIVVAGDWLYILGGATGAMPSGTTIIDAAPIAPDGSIGAFVLPKYMNAVVPLSTARTGTIAFALSMAMCVGTPGSTLECATLNNDGSLGSTFATVAGVTVPTDAGYVAVLGSNAYAFGGMSSSVLSAAPIS